MASDTKVVCFLPEQPALWRWGIFGRGGFFCWLSSLKPYPLVPTVIPKRFLRHSVYEVITGFVNYWSVSYGTVKPPWCVFQMLSLWRETVAKLFFFFLSIHFINISRKNTCWGWGFIFFLLGSKYSQLRWGRPCSLAWGFCFVLVEDCCFV